MLGASSAAFCTGSVRSICSLTGCIITANHVSCVLWASSSVLCTGRVTPMNSFTSCTPHHWHCLLVKENGSRVSCPPKTCPKRQILSFCRRRAAGFFAPVQPPEGKTCVSADRIQRASHLSAASPYIQCSCAKAQKVKLVFVQGEGSRLLRHFPLCPGPVPHRDTLCAGPVSPLQCHNLFHDLLLHRRR